MMELENNVHGTGKEVLNDIVCERSSNWQEEQKNKGKKIWKREMRAGYKRQFVEKQIFM